MFTSMRAVKRSLGALVHPGGRKMEIEVRPHERRRERLKNGNCPGDLSAVKKCGAKTRVGAICRCPAMRNGRCRLHGGLSTGPKTPEGRQRIRLALLKHGRYTKEAEQERLEWRELMLVSRKFLHQLQSAASILLYSSCVDRSRCGSRARSAYAGPDRACPFLFGARNVSGSQGRSRSRTGRRQAGS